MPNHVTNRLKITGTKEQVDAFDTGLANPPMVISGEEKRFSLGLFKPMPEILERVVEQGGGTIMVREKVGNGFAAGRPATPEEIAEITATGYRGWYNWRLDNWGTKWDCYSLNWARVSDTEAELSFDTAWSCPEPVFALMAKHPIIAPLHIEIVAFDEGWNFAFRGTIRDGEYEGNTVAATDEMYAAVYGEPPERDEEDDT